MTYEEKTQHIKKVFIKLNILKIREFCALAGFDNSWFGRKLNERIAGNSVNPAKFSEEECDRIIATLQEICDKIMKKE